MALRLDDGRVYLGVLAIPWRFPRPRVYLGVLAIPWRFPRPRRSDEAGLGDGVATTASCAASDSVDHAVLVKTRKATRGPAVTYGPGSRSPPCVRSRPVASDDAAQSPLTLEDPLIDE